MWLLKPSMSIFALWPVVFRKYIFILFKYFVFFKNVFLYFKKLYFNVFSVTSVNSARKFTYIFSKSNCPYFQVRRKFFWVRPCLLFPVQFLDHQTPDRLTTGQYCNRTQINHSNTRLVQYSDGYCTIIL